MNWPAGDAAEVPAKVVAVEPGVAGLAVIEETVGGVEMARPIGSSSCVVEPEIVTDGVVEPPALRRVGAYSKMSFVLPLVTQRSPLASKAMFSGPWRLVSAAVMVILGAGDAPGRSAAGGCSVKVSLS